MKKSRTTDKRIRKREPILDRLAAAQIAQSSSRPSGNRSYILLIACMILLMAGGACIYAYRGYVHSHQVRLASACRQSKIARDWPQLELLAREWAVWQPNRSDPWLLAADAAKEMGNPQMAVNYLLNLPSDASVEAYYELGRLQMDVLNRPRASVETFNRTLRIYPKDSQTHQRLLSFYSMTCQRDEIVREARRAILVGSESLATYAYLVGAKWLTFTNGNAINSKWLESDPHSEVFAVASVIHQIAQRESVGPSQPSAAEGMQVPMERYEQLVAELGKKYPKNIELLACRCNLFCQFGQIAEVARVLSDASAGTENDNRFWRFKGWYHLAREQWPEAKVAYARALQLWPFDWISQHELAIALRRSNDFEQATQMQARATLGKEVMGAILHAPRLDASSRETFERIFDYLQLCGETETAKSLRHRLEQAGK